MRITYQIKCVTPYDTILITPEVHMSNTITSPSLADSKVYIV